MPTGETKIVTTEFVNGFSPEQWQFCLLVVQDDYFRSLEYTKLTATEPEAKVHAEIPEKEYHKVGLIPCNRSKEFSNHFFLSFFCKWCFEKIIGIVSCRCLQYYKSDKKQPETISLVNEMTFQKQGKKRQYFPEGNFS